MSTWGIPVYLYRSVTPGVRPASLSDGQLFINQVDQVLCYPNSNGTGTFGTLSLADSGTTPISKTVEVNFGAQGAYSKEFSITDTSVTTSSKIFASVSATNPSVGWHDEIDMDPFTVQGRCTTNGTLILKIVSCTRGKLIGRRVINYMLA
jgi:hypothetical protein